MNKNQQVFENMTIPKAVATLAIPTMLSMLVNVIYNMADTYFVGQTGDANQVAAVSLTMPVFLILMAIGNIFGMGGSSFIARTLGQGNKNRVRNISSCCFWCSIASGLIMTGVFLFGMDGILGLIGASENTFQFAKNYLSVIAFGAPFTVLSFAFGNIVRGEGSSKDSMIGMMLGTIINIILDPVMILLLDMGVQGAALATVIGNLSSVIYYIFYLLKKTPNLSFSPKEFKLGGGILSGIVIIGIPAAINSALMSIANIIMNNFLASYGDIPVAAMGVALKANMLVAMLQIGLAAGVMPLIGYNYGAKKFKRMNQVIKFTAMCTVILGTAITLVYFLISNYIIGAFIDNQEVIALGTNMLRAIMLTGPVIGLLFITMNILQAMGKGVPSLILSLSRQGLAFVPILFISNSLFGLDGLIYSQPIADVVSIITAIIIYSVIMKKLKKDNIEQWNS